MSNSKSPLISLMTMKCLSFVTGFNFLFNAIAAVTASIAGTGFPILRSSVDGLRAIIIQFGGIDHH